MSLRDILRLRLANQHLVHPVLHDPAELVAWLGAVQSQDFPAACWALGLRLHNATASSVERAYSEGSILRTHVLRPTWHFVTPNDLRWMLALTAPRVKVATASTDRSLGLDEALFTRSNDAIARALDGGQRLTRKEISLALERAGIAVQSGQMLAHLVVRAELDAIVCSGPLRGRQFTYALFDERVPSNRAFDRDAALAELTVRYFTSHGPATVRDFSWWSGLTMAESRQGLAMNASRLVEETVDGLTYWFAPAGQSPALLAETDTVHLLPNYDEYTVAYRDRDLYYDPARARLARSRDESPLGNVILVGGRVAGLWKRAPHKDHLTLVPRWFDAPSESQRHAVEAAAERYAEFLGMPATLSTHL